MMKRARAIASLVVFVALHVALPAAWFVAAPRVALAADAPELVASTDADVVAEGETFTVRLKASGNGGELSEPDISADHHQLAAASAPQIGTFHEMSVRNGVMVQKQGMNVTWRVQALKAGTIQLKPSIFASGVRFSAQPVKVRIVPPGQAPPRRPNRLDPFGGGQLPDPFGGFGSLFGSNPFGDPLDFPSSQGFFDVPTDPRLSLNHARAQGTFLHASVDKTRAVIGEQVTLSIYLYIDVNLTRDPDFNDVHEAQASDFIRHSLLDDDTHPKNAGHARVGGRIWAVRLLRRVALFPIKSGDLAIGPMSLASISAGGKSANKRESEPLTVHVTEPPIDGRPPGYQIGDVGRYELSAEVTPREVDRGGMVHVTLDLSGTGNLPSKIVPPARQGIEWLPPEVHDAMGRERRPGSKEAGDVYGGKRTFSYLVRIAREGNVDLGDIQIPFYDPATRGYDVARASLGSVLIKPGGAAVVDPNADNAPLPNLPAVRTARAGAPQVSAHLADTRLFWLGLAAPTLAIAAFVGGRAASRRVRERSKAREASPEAALKQRIAEAESACAGDDAPKADAAIARALVQAAIVGVQVNVRGLETREIAAALSERGVARDVAESVQAILAECEAARFVPGGGDVTAARDRWVRARAAVAALKKGTSS